MRSGLGIVGAATLPGLEENGRESKRGNGARHGDAFFREFGQGELTKTRKRWSGVRIPPMLRASAFICPSWGGPELSTLRVEPTTTGSMLPEPTSPDALAGYASRDGSVVGVIARDAASGCGAADASCEPIPS